MKNECDFPHNGYYQSARENDCQFKTNFSSRMHVERFINGQPAFIHHDAESGLVPKTLVINDWRLYLGNRNKHQQQLMYNSLQELTNRQDNPFTIYFAYYDGFAKLENNTTLTDFVEMISMTLEAEPYFIRDNEDISQALINFINNEQGSLECSLDSVFVIDQYEMDALLIKSNTVEHSTCIQDLIHLEYFINEDINFDSKVENLFYDVCERTEFYTSNAYICFDDSSTDLYFLHEHFNDKGKYKTTFLVLLAFQNKLQDLHNTKVLSYLKKKLKYNRQGDIKPSRILECFYIKQNILSGMIENNNLYLKKRNLDESILQKTHSIHVSHPIDQLSNIDKIFNISNNITRLTLTICNNRQETCDPNKASLYLKNIDYLKNITYLSINPSDEVEIGHYQVYLTHLQNLTSLDYELFFNDASSISSKALIRKKLPSLKHLTMSGARIQAEQFHQILAHVPNIESITVQCDILGDFDRTMNSLPYLKKIDLNSIGDPSPDLKYIPLYLSKHFSNSTSSLEYLSIQSNDDANLRISMCETQTQSLLHLMEQNNFKRIHLKGFFLLRRQIKKIMLCNVGSMHSLDLTRSSPYKSENKQIRLTPSGLMTQLKFFSYREGLSFDILYEVISSSPFLLKLDFSETDTEDLDFSLPRKIALTEAFAHCRKLTSLINYNTGKLYNQHEIQKSITDRNILSLVLSELRLSPITQKTIDASFDETETPTFQCTSVFTHKSGKIPCVSTYRIEVFNQLDINPSTCCQSDAFSIKNHSDDLLLININLLDASYTQVTDLPDDTENCKFYWGEKIFEAQPCWQPIPSLSGNERLLSFKTSNKIKIEIKYSVRDNLYYLKTDTTLKSGTLFHLSFALQVPTVEITAQTLNYFKFLSNYFKKFENESLSFSSNHSYTGFDFYEMMNKQKKGCCRHRAILAKGSFDKAFPSNTTSLRIILNECHTYCELLALDPHGQIRCYRIDLGGAPGNIQQSNPLPPLIDELPEKLALDKIEALSDFNDYELSKLSIELSTMLDRANMSNPMKNFIHDEFQSVTSTRKYTVDELKATLFSSTTHQTTLLKTESSEDSYDTLLSCIYELDQSSQPYYINYHPDELLTQERYIALISGSSEGKIISERGGYFYDFLQAAKSTQSKVYLFVMYDAFSTKEIIKFNRLIDENDRFADSVELPENVAVIGIYNTKNPKAYKGADFLSRFKNKFCLTPQVIQKEESIDEINLETQPIVIELFNDPFWQERLLGHWQMQGNKLYFIKSEFVESLESGNGHTFVFNNPPTNLAFYHCLEKAKQQGYFTVNGQNIPLPNNFSYAIKEGYDYSPFLSHIQVSIAEHIDPTSMMIINDSILEDFIGGYIIEPTVGQIQINLGYIQTHAASTPLRLFIHTNLSEASWSKLLSKIHRSQIQVEIITPSSDLLPEPLINDIHIDEHHKNNPMQQTKRQRIDENIEQPVVVIKDQEGDIDFAQSYYIEQFNIDPRACLIIDVSEVTEEQLIYQVNTEFNDQTSSFIFKKQPGILLNSQYQQTTVILRGIFSASLVNILSKLLCQRLNILQNTISQRLLLIPQNSDCFDFLPTNIHFTVKPSAALRVRHKQLYVGASLGLTHQCIKEMIDREEVLATPLAQLQGMCYKPNKHAPWQGSNEVTHHDYSNDDINFTDAPTITMQFYQHRLDEIEKRLQVNQDNPISQSCFVYLTGLTGVGKTHFIQNHWASKYPNCHYGMAHLKDFCLDTREGIKTLFIDEANLENTDYSLFEGLFSAVPHLLIGQKIVYLTPHHKVIFAGNPSSYSKDRKEFSFAKRHGNYCLFSEIPPEVLFEVVLKPLFGLYQFNQEVTIKISELFLQRQFFVNHLANRIIISPRELTAMVLMTMQKTYALSCLNDIINHADAISHQVIKSAISAELYENFCQTFAKPLSSGIQERATVIDDFVLTSSRIICQETIETLLSIREQRQNSMLLVDNDTFKYDGINAALMEGEPGIGKSALVQKVLKENTIPFIQISASMPIEDKEAILIDAFNDGKVVLMDEYNTAHLNEKFMNAILSGIHPITHQRPHTPGFILIATQNPPSMSGRTVFGDAIKRRFLHCPLPAYTHSEMVTIIENLGIDNSTANYLVLYYQQQRLEQEKEGSLLCFRDLLNIAKKVAAKKSLSYTNHLWSSFFDTDPVILGSDEEDDNFSLWNELNI